MKANFEQIKPFENQLQVNISNFLIKNDDDNSVTIYCELSALESRTIAADFNVECIIYSKSGEILDKMIAYVYNEEFMGFEVLEC